MEDSKGSGGGDRPGADAGPNPTPNQPPPVASSGGDDDAAAVAAAAQAEDEARRPFTALSQVDADLALARVLQEQERAYMMLRMNGGGGGGEGSDYGSSEAGSYDYDDEDAEDYEEDLEHHLRVHHHDHPAGNDGDVGEDVDGEGEDEGSEESEYEEEGFDEDVEPEVDPAEYEDDEAYARALQDAEEREVAARLLALAGISDWRAVEHVEDHVNDAQDPWQEVDPDEYSYEELVALGEVVGTESRGLSADTLASLPSVTYKTKDMQDGNTEQCVICRVEFEDGESLVALPCKHSYHPECINQWLQINKIPVPLRPAARPPTPDGYPRLLTASPHPRHGDCAPPAAAPPHHPPLVSAATPPASAPPGSSPAPGPRSPRKENVYYEITEELYLGVWPFMTKHLTPEDPAMSQIEFAGYRCERRQGGFEALLLHCVHALAWAILLMVGSWEHGQTT